MLPDRPGDAARHRHDRVLREPDAALAPDLDLRLPHPRGGLDRDAGARVHARRTASRTWSTALERGLAVDEFAPRLLLLQRAHRLLRGDREVPGRPAHLGPRAARHVRGAGRAFAPDALPHPDRRCVADRPAAANNIVRTATEALVGGARRHAVAAHQQLRRGARAADRGGRARRPAHPADHRPRDRRREHDRSARRLLLRRGTDRPHGAGRLRLLQQDRRARRHGRRDQAELPPARDRRRELPAPGRDTRPAGA